MQDYSRLLVMWGNNDTGPTYLLTMVSLSIFLDAKNTTIAPDKLAR